MMNMAKSKLELKLISKISLQEYADSVVNQEYRQPLKTLQEAISENGWEAANPVCCGNQININSMIGFAYFAQCRVCGRFIADVAGPSFSETGSSVRFIDQDKFTDDTDWTRTWIAGTELRDNS